MIILSKTVRRECRGAMYGICSAFGAIGGFSGLTLGKLTREILANESLYALEMILALVVIMLIYISKIYKDKSFERPMQYKKKIMRLTNIMAREGGDSI